MGHQDARVLAILQQALQVEALAGLDFHLLTELEEHEMPEHGMSHEDKRRRRRRQGLELDQIWIALTADLQDLLIQGRFGWKVAEEQRLGDARGFRDFLGGRSGKAPAG